MANDRYEPLVLSNDDVRDVTVTAQNKCEVVRLPYERLRLGLTPKLE